VLVGGVAGYFGGRVDALLMRLTELVLVFPTFFLLILAVSVFGRSVTLLVLLISLTSWPAGARIMRGEVMKLRERDFVLAALSTGVSHVRVLLRHVLPNVVGVIIVSATVRVGSNILTEAGLSYLDLGVQPPLASWGNMIADGSSVFRTAWWVTGMPAIAIFLTVFAFNLLGEGLRDYFNPRER
jgi:peptide/nickel transport system permease protein